MVGICLMDHDQCVVAWPVSHWRSMIILCACSYGDQYACVYVNLSILQREKRNARTSICLELFFVPATCPDKMRIGAYPVVFQPGKKNLFLICTVAFLSSSDIPAITPCRVFSLAPFHFRQPEGL